MKDIIKNYVNNLTYNDIKEFIHRSNYHIKEEEIEVIYKYIKNYCDDILNENPEVFNHLKEEVCEETYEEIMKLCNKYKKFL